MRNALEGPVADGLRTWLADDVAPRAGYATAGVGAGLTTLVASIIDDLRLEPVWLTPSATKNVVEALRDARRTRLAATGKRKVIVLDEFECSDRGAVAAAAEHLPDAKVPKLLCLGHPTRSKKAVEFAKRWARFDFPDVGDVRFAATGCGDKDVFLDGLDGVDLVLRKDGATVAGLWRAHESEPGAIPAGVFENYPHVLSSEDAYDVLVASRVSDSFSLADVIAEQTFGTWDDLWVISTVAAGMELQKRFGTATDFRADKFGTMWSRMHNARAKAKNVALVNSARQASGLERMTPEDLAWQRAMISSAVADEDLLRACHGLDERTVLAVMRLGTGPYNHARVKKLLK